MGSKKYDVVYILKHSCRPDELKYSIRSVCENFDFSRIVFVGGKPCGLTPDLYINFSQGNGTKWDKTFRTIHYICYNTEISENFWLFNDDFFIMKPNPILPITNGTLLTYAHDIEQGHGGPSRYTIQLRQTAAMLQYKGYDIRNFDTHTPILINKQKGYEIVRRFPNYHATFRSVYGNVNNIKAIEQPDVKIAARTPKEVTGEETLLSTTEYSFNNRAVGKYIQSMFPNPCKYEVEFEI